MHRVLVTGSGGFLGCHLVRRLEDLGVCVTTLGRHPARGLHVALGELPWSADAIESAIAGSGADVVFHMAGTSVGSRTELELVNVGMMETIILALRRFAEPPVLVCCGSATEYGAALIDGVPARETSACAPAGPYGVTKLAQSLAALRFAEETGARVLVARIFNPIGPGMPTHLALGDFARQLAAKSEARMILRTGNLDVFRDFIDVAHIVGILDRLARTPDARGVVNLCSGKATRLRDLVTLLIAASGKQVALETASARLRPGELASITGSTARLSALGATPPQTDFPRVIARLWEDARIRWRAAA
jgi:GDP-4-dehydro-6-deoxy-D-mannose reductase